MLCCEATGVASGVDSGYGSRTADSVEEAQADLKSISSIKDSEATVGQQITSTSYGAGSRPFDIHQDVLLSRCLDSLCNTVDGKDTSWPTFPSAPVGNYPLHCCDGLHNDDGHGLRHSARDPTGEQILNRELAALYVSNAYLDLALVVEARKVEMKLFDEMQVYDRVDRSKMLRRGENNQELFVRPATASSLRAILAMQSS